MTRRKRWTLVLALVLAGTAALALPSLVRAWWAVRSDNPVRRGVARAEELGCFRCHGWLGGGGIVDPGPRAERVPAWTGGDWQMYVMTAGEVRDYILDGYAGDPNGPAAARHRDPDPATVPMPAYREFLRGRDLENLVAAFQVISGMVRPPADTDARRGEELARRWSCFSCHGPGGCGGRANPGSFTGFIPGWYGADFADLVRDRAEFDEWLRTGRLERLASNPLAAWFIRRQRVSMPAYPDLTAADRDALWAYTRWLAATDGGHAPENVR